MSESDIISEGFSFIQPLVILAFCFIMGYAFCKRERIEIQIDPLQPSSTPNISIDNLTNREKKRLNGILKDIKSTMDKIAKIDEELKTFEAKIPNIKTNDPNNVTPPPSTPITTPPVPVPVSTQVVNSDPIAISTIQNSQ
jgi:hypothetical protein